MAERHEEKVDIIIQATGLIASLGGVAVLVYLTLAWADGIATAAALTYGLTLIAMFACSILNATVQHPGRRSLVRLLDHAFIYLLIAGTYTPFCLMVIGGTRGVNLLIGIWFAALLGVIIRVAFHRRLKGAIITLYILMGWSGLINYDVIVHRLTATGLVLLAIGGVLYTVGAPLHRWSGLRYHSAIWHSCVLLAAGCHYYAVLLILTAFHGQALV